MLPDPSQSRQRCAQTEVRPTGPERHVRVRISMDVEPVGVYDEPVRQVVDQKAVEFDIGELARQ